MIDMPSDEQKQAGKGNWLIAAALIAVGTAISAFALAEIGASRSTTELAQATQQVPSSPPNAQGDVPAEPKPGGTRPTTPAPEPARPDPDAQKAGSQPSLPPAPAEKTGPPIKEK